MGKEYIDREALLKQLDLLARHEDDFRQSVILGVAHTIKKFPAADVVEVVRCRDCKRWMKDVPYCNDFVGRCSLAKYMIGATGYCLYGERKDGDTGCG